MAPEVVLQFKFKALPAYARGAAVLTFTVTLDVNTEIGRAHV